MKTNATDRTDSETELATRRIAVRAAMRATGQLDEEKVLMSECDEFIDSFPQDLFESQEAQTKAAFGFFQSRGLDRERAQALAARYCQPAPPSKPKPQSLLNVCCLGPSASFPHLAAMQIFKNQARYQVVAETRDIFDCLHNMECDFGLIPISNTVNGPTDDNIDLLYSHLVKTTTLGRRDDSPLTICGEHLFQVDYCLIGEASNIDNLTVIHSHAQGFQQCRESLVRLEKKLGHKLHLVTEATASAAARRAAEDTTGSVGAIAHKLTAELLRLKVLRPSIQDQAASTMRFLLIGRQKPDRTGADKTSIWLRMKDEAGALVNTLKFLSRFNCTNLVSRPIPDEANAHSFFIEFEGHIQDEAVTNAIEMIENLTSSSPMWLGSYPVCKSSEPDTPSDCGDILPKPSQCASGEVKTNIKVLSKLPPLPNGVSNPLKIGIIGHKGKYGSWFDKFFREKFGYKILGSDIEVDESKNQHVVGLSKQEVVRQSDVVVFAVPLNCMNAVIRECVPYSNNRQLWMDIASVKGTSVPGMLDSEAEIISLHPMCGPDLSNWRGQSVNVCPVRCPNWMDWCKAVLKTSEAKVEYSGPESHDRLMAILQAMPHAFYFAAAGVLRSLNVDLPELQRLATPTYSMMWYGMNRFISNASELSADIQLENRKFTLDTLDQMLIEIGMLREMVNAGDRPKIIDYLDQTRDFIGDDLRIAGTQRFVRLSRINADFENQNSIEIFKVQEPEHASHSGAAKAACDRPGLLEEAVKVFAIHGVNMTSLHSEGNTEHGYHFLIGTTDPRSSECVQKVISDLRQLGWNVTQR